ncbi:MAG TPA: serine hydrolase [Thermoanaerobaculia bacterium]|nr:serine hydrolase [Thermoanaerobaculia bacterium]
MVRLLLLFCFALTARADFRELTDVARDPAIEYKVRTAAEATLKAYPKLKADDLAISVIDVTKPDLLARGDYHGDAPFYPASVIKLFFMTDVYATKKEKIGDVDRALREMIVVSDNDATAYLVDLLAGTVPGPPLEGRALQRYIERRRDINRRFQRLGYADHVSAMMKPWSFGPYGVDLQVLGKNRENRNKLTANATASLLLWIVRRRAPGAEASMKLLERPLSPPRQEENQVKGFLGEALPAGARLWSKAGWTSEVRHDAAYVELPDGRKFVVVIFTRGIAEDVTIVPAVAKNVFGEL